MLDGELAYLNSMVLVQEVKRLRIEVSKNISKPNMIARLAMELLCNCA